MAAKFSIRSDKGGLLLFKGDELIGPILRCHSDSRGISVIAGTITNLLYLNDENCDLPAVERALADMTAPS